MSQNRNQRLTAEITYAFILKEMGISDPKELKKWAAEREALNKQQKESEKEANKLISSQIKHQTSSHQHKNNHPTTSIQQPAGRRFK